jgi:hypothetical protein
MRRRWDGRVERSITGLAVLLFLASCTSDEPISVIPAPNVVSPAPDPLPGFGMNGECVVGIIRADHVAGRELLDLLGAHVPTWLPEGFGLFIGWKVEGGFVSESSNGGIWTDEHCRQVRLDLLPGAAIDESPRPDGKWVLVDRGKCTFGPVRNVSCVTYHAQANGDALTLMAVGLSDRDTTRVVSGVGV